MLAVDRMQRALKAVLSSAIEGTTWQKLSSPTASRGKTAFPKKPADQQRLGVRFDYDGVIEKDGTEYHKYQMQANAGDDIPSSIKNWRNANGGTHAIMSDVYVKKDGTKEDVEEGLKDAIDKVRGAST
jgi:hypothetical protein